METVSRAVLDWLALSFDGEVVWSNQAAPRPAFPYMTAYWFGEVEVGMAESIQESVARDISEQVEQTRRLTLQLEAYGGPAGDLDTLEPMELLETSLLYLQTLRVVTIFRGARMAFISHERVLRLDEFDGDRWERRALCDVHLLHLATTEAESIGQIDTAVPTFNELDSLFSGEFSIAFD